MTPSVHLRCAFLLLGVAVRGWPAGRKCPREPPTNGGAPGKEEVHIAIKNEAGAPMGLYYRTSAGSELDMGTVQPGEQESYDSFPGHVFVARSMKTRKLVHVVQVTSSTTTEAITACERMDEEDVMELDTSRWDEFERLAAVTQMECKGEFSSGWSCVRDVTPEELQARDSSMWGFSKEEAEGTPYKQGATKDYLHLYQQKFIPNVTAFEGGYLKMDMTEKLKALLTHYKNTKQNSHKASVIPGFFTNNHIVSMDMLGMNSIMTTVKSEMGQILEWWTKKRLRHTTTFGIRIYKRDAMLINHLDRKDSHLVSAILQVHQVADKDGGWPVEVIHPHRPGLKEVYLQPGEMLLYEGARLEHGRPMRFRGEEFANVFSHFVPEDYNGPNEKWRNPFLDKGETKAEL